MLVVVVFLSYWCLQLVCLYVRCRGGSEAVAAGEAGVVALPMYVLDYCLLCLFMFLFA